jgi:hypothetical protein
MDVAIKVSISIGNHAMLLVKLGMNSTRDVWKFSKLDSPQRLVQFWQNFQTSRVLLIPNCTSNIA